MEHYLCEIARVMKWGGRCLITLFLWNEGSLRLINAGKSVYEFKYKGEGFRTIDRATSESGGAYDEKFIRVLYEKFRLTVVEPIHVGSWCGRENYLSYQDVIVAIKK